MGSDIEGEQVSPSHIEKDEVDTGLAEGKAHISPSHIGMVEGVGGVLV